MLVYMICLVSASTLLASVFFDTTQLPPQAAFYDANDLGWMTVVKVISAIIAGTCLYVLMWMMSANVLSTKTKVLRTRFLAESCLFATGGTWIFLVIPTNIYGGFWNMIALGFGIMTAIAGVFACYVTSRSQKKIMQIDALIDEMASQDAVGDKK